MLRGERPTGEGNGKSRWIHSEGENFLRASRRRMASGRRRPPAGVYGSRRLAARVRSLTTFSSLGDDAISTFALAEA